MKIKIVIGPRMHHPPRMRKFDHFPQWFPPYGAACLVTSLKAHGYTVGLEDISIRADELWSYIILFDNVKAFKHLENYLIHNITHNEVDSFAEKLFHYISKDQADVIGFSIFSAFNLPSALLLAKKLKEKIGVPIVFGGALITKYTEYSTRKRVDTFLKNFKFIDYLIFGEGPVPLLKLLAYLQGKIKISAVPNLVYRKRDKVIINERKLFNIEDMPLPDFDDLALDRYREIQSQWAERWVKKSDLFMYESLQLPYQITRGCAQKCSFCTYYLVDPRVELKSHQKVIHELAQLKEKYHTNHFFFCESRLNISYQYLEKLCDLIIGNKLNIIWRSPASINNMDKSLLIKMKKAGCFSLTWGVESGSYRILKMMNKGFSASQAAQILRDSHQEGITNVVNFITGFVQETDEDINQTIKFIQDNAAYIDKARAFDFALLPYSQIYNHPENFGIKNIHKDYRSIISFGSIGWDEIDGLTWKDKLKEKRKVYRKVQAAINRIFAYED